MEIKKEITVRNKETLRLLICNTPKVKADVIVLVIVRYCKCLDTELLRIGYSVETIDLKNRINEKNYSILE